MQVLERLSDIERDFEQQPQPRLVRAPLMEQPMLQRLPQRACPTQSNIRSESALQPARLECSVSKGPPSEAHLGNSACFNNYSSTCRAQDCRITD